MTHDTTPITKADLTGILDRLNLVPTRDEMLQVIQTELQPIKTEIAEMRENMVTKKEADRFATKDDLHRFATKDDLDRAIKGVNVGIDQVLTVLVNVDKRLTQKTNNHDVRIKRLEKKTGLATMVA